MTLEVKRFMAGISTLLFAGGAVFMLVAAVSARTTTDIIAEYPRLFSVHVLNVNGELRPDLRIDSLPATDVLGPLMNTHEMLVDYLVKNYLRIDWDRLDSLTGDTVAMQRYFAEAVRHDSSFNASFLRLVGNDLAARGEPLTDYTPLPVRTITLDTLADLAARFFYATSIDDSFRIGWHVCVGLNGIMQEPHEPWDPLLEGFCFMAIYQCFEDTTCHVHDHYIACARKIGKELKTHPVENPLAHARTRMVALMREDEELRGVLKSAFARDAAILNCGIDRR